MFAFLERHKKIILTSVIIILAALALFTSGKKANATWLESALGFVITPIQDVTTGVGNWVDNTLTNRREQSEIVAENEALREQVASLQSDINRLQKYETENARLSSLLRIAQKYPQYDSFGTTIIAKNPGSWYDVFTIDKGTSDGVKSNMVLCSAEGLVGKVLESGATYAKGQSILDSRSSVPAMSLRTEDLGVVKGDYTLMNDGLCKMEYIDAEAEIAVGDEIVTSHLSDIYPPGLTIGKVKEIKNDTNGLTKYAIIEPAVDLKHLDTLLVIDNSDVQAQNEAATTDQTTNTTDTTDTTNTTNTSNQTNNQTINQTSNTTTNQTTNQTSDMAPEEETP
mgnify:FL=1